jgi:hypothetical protein
MSPQRIQRQRSKGWRMPEGAVYVGRPTIYGNPFRYRTSYGLARVPALDGSPWEYEGRISADGAQHNYHHPDGTVTQHHVRYMTQAETVELYRRALVTPTPHLRIRRMGGAGWFLTVELVRAELAGKDLACWCRPTDPCHADVLLEIANGEVPS